MRDACECVFYSVHRIVLKKSFDVSYLDISPDMGVGGMDRTGPGCQVGDWSDHNAAVGLVWRGRGPAELSTEYAH